MGVLFFRGSRDQGISQSDTMAFPKGSTIEPALNGDLLVNGNNPHPSQKVIELLALRPVPHPSVQFSDHNNRSQRSLG